MRKPEYLSPSSINLYFKDTEAYYIKYMSDHKLASEPQTQAMSIGSSLDAYVKSYLFTCLFGASHKDFDKYEFNTIFEAQVQPHHRDWARHHGEYVFDCYKKSGALSDLLLQLKQAVGDPRFEIEISGTVDGYTESLERDIGAVRLLGKPDVFFNNKEGQPVILDFKVNGYCSKSGASPKQGYVQIRGSERTGCHRNAHLLMHRGIIINAGMHLEDVDAEWAVQLAIYGWLCGQRVGEQFVVALDQFCCKPNGTDYPTIRIAEHRTTVSERCQKEIFQKADLAWVACQSGHVFREMSVEDCAARCRLLDGRSKALSSGDPLMRKMMNL